MRRAHGPCTWCTTGNCPTCGGMGYFFLEVSWRRTITCGEHDSPYPRVHSRYL
jgi:hypothetical protein